MKYGLILMFLFPFLFKAKGQDAQFTQFYGNPLYLNPALVGSANTHRINSNYRNQWPAFAGKYITQSISYDTRINESNSLGALFLSDNAGDGGIKTINASLLYAYNLNISSNFNIRMGFQSTYFQKSIDWDNYTFGDMIDARFGTIYDTKEIFPNQTIHNVDFSIGVLGYTKNFYVGHVIHHITEPVESFLINNNRLLRKFTLHSGYIFNSGKYLISPNILLLRQGPTQQLLFGMYGKKGPFVAGLWYRNRDSFITLVGLQTDYFRFGYSYDLTVSRLTNKPGGSHEISLSIRFIKGVESLPISNIHF